MNRDLTVHKTEIEGLLKIERPVFDEDRGYFHEVFRLNDLEKVTGKKFKACQWSHSYSKPRVIRALHSERWQKVIYPVTGKMFTALVDVRKDSKTFAKVETFEFDTEKKNYSHAALYLPPGIANSICVMGAKPLHYMYLVDEYWDNSKAQGIAWDDPDLNIKWPVKNPILSERDQNNPTLRELYPNKFK